MAEEKQIQEQAEKQSMLPEIRPQEDISAVIGRLTMLEATIAAMARPDSPEEAAATPSVDDGRAVFDSVTENSRRIDMLEASATDQGSGDIPIEDVVRYIEDPVSETDDPVTAASLMLGNSPSGEYGAFADIGTYTPLNFNIAENSNIDVLEANEGTNSMCFKVNGWYLVAFGIPRIESDGSGWSLFISPSLWRAEYYKSSDNFWINSLAFSRHIHITEAPENLSMKMIVGRARVSFTYVYHLSAHFISED